MKITLADLSRWKKNSVKIALELKYDPQIVNHIDKNLKFNLWDELPQQSKQIWFGWTHADSPEDVRYPQVSVFSRNMSTEPYSYAKERFVEAGLTSETVDKVILPVIEKMGRQNFFEIFNQNGVDHEVMGHLYHFLKFPNDESAHDEKVALMVQMEFAKIRAGPFLGHNWRRIVEIMNLVFKAHRGIPIG